MERIRAIWAWLTAYIATAWHVTANPTESPGTDTEFTAEIVRITEISPHVNADRLEIARFELKGSGESSYEVVIQKGSFKAGDLAGYFSVDCILPLSHPDFSFLKDRLDGAGKTLYRLRAARLRGVFSQGLLVPVVNGDFGERIAERYGVTYHREPEPEERLPAQPSRRPRVQPLQIYEINSLKKVPHLFEPGEQVVITEKIHGCNFRFGWVPRAFLGVPLGYKFVVGSHRMIKGDNKPGFYGEDVWLRAAMEMNLKKKTKPFKGYAFYGELYGYTYTGKAIQDLTYGRDPKAGPGLACFDIQEIGGHWLTPFERRAMLADAELPEVPVLYAGPYIDDLSFPSAPARLAEGESMLHLGWPNKLAMSGDAIIREGCVVEGVHVQRKKAKYVGQGYLLRKELPQQLKLVA